MKTVLLADLIRGAGISDEVPATGATDATQEKGVKLTVAKVAGVAVASPEEPKCDDDRQWCSDCRFLDRYGYCRAAAQGLIEGAGQSYAPWQGLPRRCKSFINKRLCQ